MDLLLLFLGVLAGFILGQAYNAREQKLRSKKHEKRNNIRP
jgi:hypothetical protein